MGEPVSITAAEGFGASVVTGLQAADADTPSATALQDALWKAAVLVIRQPAPLDDDGARTIASMFGPIKDPIALTTGGHPLRYAEQRQVMDSGYVLRADGASTDDRGAARDDTSLGGDDLRPGLFLAFHTDDTYTPAPAAASVLHARQLPTTGGATRFLDMRAAYDLLDPETKGRLESLRAVHAYDNGGAFPPRPAATGPLSRLVPVAHPIVRRHPVTGSKALYFDLDRATHIEGLPTAEGRRLLQSLQDHAERLALTYDHQWQPNDVLVWDNASVQHAAAGDFAFGEPRRFWRYLIAGPAPR